MSPPEHTHEPAAADQTGSAQPAGTADPAAHPEPSEAIDDARFRTLIGRGPIAPLSVWRRVYTTLDLPWPGDAEIRRRHRVANPHTNMQLQPTVWQLSWQTPDQRQPHHGIDTGQQHEPSSRDAERPTLQRLADTLGGDQVPILTAEEKRHIDRDFNAAQAKARRCYGLDHAGDPPAAEPARPRPVRPIRSANDLIQPGMFHSDDELDEFLADLHATRRGGTTATILNILADTHNDVTWLKRGLRALLDHHGIRIHDLYQPGVNETDNDES